MPYNIRKNWLSAFDLIKEKPVTLLPFVIVAFLEGLAVEIIYFLPRKPISIILGPIIRKFFGEPCLHYPNDLILLPRIFYYAQMVIYVFMGVFLTAVCVNIVKNIKTQLPLKTKAIVKNAMARYFSFLIYGILMITLTYLVWRTDKFIFYKYMGLIQNHVPQIMIKLAPLKLALFLFISNVLMQVFTLFVVPIIVIEKKSFPKALAGSVYMGARYFPRIFKLIFLPFLLYLPLSLLKSVLPKLVDKTVPEITVFITAAGIIIAIFIDCFITVCAAQFLLEKKS